MPPNVLPLGTVINHIERLGLRTYGKEQENPHFVVRRPVFRYEPVLKLHKVELPALFGLLLRDEGNKLDRSDPKLFEKELDELLEKYGPLIWPKLGQGDRNHLRDPQPGTLYTSALVYPRDSAIIKGHLRSIILGKTARRGTDVDALINKTHKEAKPWMNNQTIGNSDSAITPQVPESELPTRSTSGSNADPDDDSSSEDSVMGTTTRLRSRRKTTHSLEASFRIELRLYRNQKLDVASDAAHIRSYGALLLTDECDTSGDCFIRVCEKTQDDCNFMIFRLPEDMSQEGSVRIDRGSRDCETAFQHVRGILERATKFPGEPQYRSVELEVGLEILEDD